MAGIFEGTIIGEIEQLAEAGDFGALELTEPVRDSDKVLGEMTALEKAVFSLFMLKGKELDTLCGDCDNQRDESTCEKHAQAHLLKRQIKTLQAICWPLIQERLQISGGNYSLRKDFKIVEICDEEAEEMRPRSRIQVIHVGLGNLFGG